MQADIGYIEFKINQCQMKIKGIERQLELADSGGMVRKNKHYLAIWKSRLIYYQSALKKCKQP